ncbi:MAG: N-acetyltransferase [Sedimentisphaerales bacterium]|nr:N-acetyltransferase [Sedimentisphaerales bacterium]
MIIRKEKESDVDAIFAVTAAAFENHPYSRQPEPTEPFIINALRAAGALTVSLVAEDEGKVVGHVAFSPVTISDGSAGWYGLGPVSVWPECQRRGIGTALVNEGLGALKVLGARGCVLVGEPAFYQRFGFRSIPDLTMDHVPQENVLVLPFGENTARGVVAHHEGFWVTS